MRKTKIVCTIGPACSDEATLTEMCRAGMNVARLNFSHGTHADHLDHIEKIKRIREKLNLPIAILLDTKGPEYRIRTFKDGKVMLHEGDTFTFTTDESVIGDETRVAVSYAGLADDLEAGDLILLNNGLLAFRVDDVRGGEVITTVTTGGELSDRKSMSFPGKVLHQVYLSEQDKDDIRFGLENGVDFIACSFVSCRQDLVDVKNFLRECGDEGTELIAKIENRAGIENIEEICEECSGIMIGRGDMGVEIPFERLPGIQKHFIRSCCQAGKTVITATQMLDSMEENRRPTRAEISDVANAVFDGSSAVMLSGETAAGKYPVDAVKTMARIAEQAEQDAFAADIYKNIWHAMDHSDNTNAVSAAACTMAEQTYAQAIIADTSTGKAARRVAKYRPAQMILAATPSEKVYHQLSLVWGVYPLRTQPVDSVDVLFHCAIEKAKELGYLHSGDTVVMTAGIPLNTHGSTNMVKVQTIR